MHTSMCRPRRVCPCRTPLCCSVRPSANIDDKRADLADLHQGMRESARRTSRILNSWPREAAEAGLRLYALRLP